MSAAHVPEATSEYAGCVMIRSMETAEAMHHFRAHDGPLSFVKFDAVSFRESDCLLLRAEGLGLLVSCRLSVVAIPGCCADVPDFPPACLLA
jgi:hypothetical protein